MDLDAALRWLTWTLAIIAAVAVVLLVMARRWALRFIVAGSAGALLVVVFAVRAQLAAIPTDEPESLCHEGISWFGVQLHGSSQLCRLYEPQDQPTSEAPRR